MDESNSENLKKKSNKLVYFIFTIILLLIILHLVCKDEYSFQDAIDDCKDITDLPVCSNLTTIPIMSEGDFTQNVSFIVVVTWTDDNSRLDYMYYNYNNYSQTDRYYWVTKVPELKEWIKNNNQKPVTVLRIKQLLGLKPEDTKTKFIEMTTLAVNLFRPAYNPYITSNETLYDFPSDIKNSSQTKWFVDWFKKNDTKKYPWTKLGYTLDWGNPDSKIGLSEFVIKEGAKVYNVKSFTNSEYINKNH